MCLGMFFVVASANAQATFTAKATANWNLATTWTLTSGTDADGIPDSNDNVIVSGGFTVTTISTSACNNLNIASGSTLIVGGANSITVSGTTLVSGTLIHNATGGTKRYTGLVTINVGGTWNNTGDSAINFRGGITNNGIFDSGSGVQTFSSSNQSITGTISIENISISSNTLTNNGVLTVLTTLTGTFTNTGTLNFAGTSIGATVTATAAGNTINYNGAAQVVGNFTYFNLTTSGSGDKTLAGPITVRNLLISTGTWLIDNDKQITGNSAGTLTLQTDGGLQLGGGDTTLSVDPTSFPSGYLVGNIDLKGQVKYNYNGKKAGTQTISTIPTYYDLECQFPGIKRVATGTLTIKRNFATASHLDLSTNNPTINLSGNFTLYAVGANVSLTSNPFSIGGNFVNNLVAPGTFSNGGGSVIFNGTGDQLITGNSGITTAFNNFTVNKTSGILSLTSSNQTVGSNLTITAGTLDLSTFTLNRIGSGGILTVSNGATLRIGDTSNYPANFGTYTLGATSIVDYYALANQTVGAVKYGNLVLSGSGIKTFPTSIVTIAGDLNINSGVVANLSTAAVTHTAATLTLGGMTTPAGIWGNTVSNPSNINDTYFAATLGKVNVGGSCVLPIVYAMSGVNNKTYCSVEAGSTIGLPNSETGVSYQLMKGNVAVGAAKDGTNGSSLTFGIYNSTGTYTIIATRVSTLCKSTMSGPINIYRTSSPLLPTASVTNASCPGTATGSINVTNVVAPSSLSFVSANSQYVDLRTTLLSDRTAFTVEGWIKFDATKVLPRMSIFGQNDVIEIAFEDGGVKGWTQYGSVLVPLTEITGGYVWHHIAVTGDATSLKIYLDGGAPKTTNISISNFGSSTDSTKMGYGVMDSGGTGLTGEVFKLGFWNRALTAGEVTTLSSGFVEYDASLNGLLAGYSFNESAGSTIASVGSAAPIGYLENGPVWTDPYTYSWTSSPAGFTSSSKNITGLTDRTYNLTTSLKGCTNAGSWTVNATNLATTVTGQPSSTAICVGSNTSFGVTATGTNLSYKWQYSTNGGGAFNDLTNNATYSNVATATLNITAATVAMSTYQYRCVVTGICLPALNSNAATLTVNPATVGGTIASSAPTNSLCTAANSTTLTLSGQTGTVLRWESSTDNLFSPPTPISNTTTSLPISNITTTTYYRAVVKSGSCNTVNSSVIKIITGKPTANAATAPNCAGFTANWNKVDGATTYLISISTNNFTTILSAYNGKDVQGDVNSFAVTGLSPNTTYQYQIHASLPCGTYATASNIISVTTSDLPIAGTFTGGAAAICIGEKTTFANATPGGTWSISNGTGTASITNVGVVTGGTQGQVNVVYTVNNGTCSNSISRSLTINPPFTAPIVGTVTPVSCSVAGSIVLSGLPAGSWKIAQSGFATNSIDGTESTITISGLAKGNYSFTVTSENCTSGSTASIEIKDESSTSWNGTSWSNGDPNKDKSVIITSVSPNQPFIGNPDLTIYTNIFACSLTVDSGSGEVIVPSNVTLTVSNAVITSGNLRFKNNSSLVQVNDDPLIVNSGNITYERTTTPLFRKDYVYWSTPVSPQTLGALSPSSSLMYSNDGTKWVAEAKTNTMSIGNGYIIRAPDNYYVAGTRQIFEGVFIGKPNNGVLEGLSLAEKKSYVIGNPYPSALDADKLLDTNKMLDGTIYFWTHNTPAKVVVSNQYSSDDYASYNLSGGVSAKSDPDYNDDPAYDKGNKPTGKIAAGQAFYVRVLVAGKVKFNNSMRVGGTQNTQFFKPGASGAIEKNRVWLNMTSTGGAFKQLLVAYVEGASNDYESRYDGLTFSANPSLDFYSVNSTRKFVIQGRALPFVDTDIVPLGYKTTVAGDLTISIDEVDGKMTNQAIYVEDKTTGEIHDLRASNYTFKSEIGTFLDRLVLRYTARTLGTGDFENLENGILVSVKNKVINVLSSKENIKEVTVFDVSGKLLYNKKKVGNTELQISNLPFGDQVLLVKVTLDNDFTTTKKIVF
ncbi:Uncharacterised protein [Flavobacterium hibernum]|nr:Uncharacterised protein [Flavobacterium hibernum]